jgi:hypothetical protein
MAKELIKKHLVRPFLDKTPESTPTWVQIKKAVDFTRSMNPTTEERNYISDEQASTEITGYKPSEGLSVTTYKGEEDFELLYSLYKKRATGADAQTNFLLVYLFDSVTNTEGKTYYYADKTECVVAIDEFNTSSSQISATIYENGTPVKGYVEITDGQPVFTAGDMPEA